MLETPQTLEQWIDYLENRPLFVRNSILRRLQYQLQNKSVTLQELGVTIKLDPVMCMQVVRQAARLHKKINSRVTSIDHAINSLGLTNIKEVINRTTTLRLNPTSLAQKMYFRHVAISHHAATQAISWLKKRHIAGQNEVALATLFYSVGHWSLWLHAALHMSQIQILIRDDVDVVLAETDILGCTVQEISCGLMERWGISKLAVVSLNHENSPDNQTLNWLHQRAVNDEELDENILRNINLLVQEKFFPVKLANWLALTAHLGWHQQKTMKIIKIINDYLKGNLADTIQHLHINCVQSSRTYHVPGTLSLAGEMLMLPSNRKLNCHFSAKEQEQLSRIHPTVVLVHKPILTAIDKQKLEPIQPNKSLYRDIMQNFISQQLIYTKPNSVFRALTKGLHYGLGFERIVIFLINQKQHKMRAAFTLGFPEQHPINTFEYNLEIPSLFKRLSNKAGYLHIQPRNWEDMMHKLPENYHSWGNNKGFILMSIFKNERPLAILHADYSDPTREISSSSCKQLTQLCSAASKCLSLI